MATKRADARPVDSAPVGPVLEGRVVRMVQEKGFGFIQVAGDEEEFFFHVSNCYDGAWERILTHYDAADAKRGAGPAVTFEATTTAKGPRAEKVRTL